MTIPEPDSPLVAARRRAATSTQQRAEAAIRRLVKRRAPISVAAVAAEAGVSSGYLHRHPELGPRIRQLRDARPANEIRAVAAASPTITDTLREHIRRLEADHQRQIGALRAENASLRADLESTLGELLALRRQHSPPE